jgi:hypothetical protein
MKIIFLFIFETGNYTVDIASSPMLFDVIVEAAKMVSTSIVSFFVF